MNDLSLDTTVRAIAAELPGAAELFRRAGINFCCGGNVSLADAADDAGLDPTALLGQLGALAEAANRDAPEETGALVDHILTRYHAVHREEFDWLIPLAQKVERVHGGHAEAPLGLTEALVALRDDLDGHMAKEELMLFPVMRQGGSPGIGYPIAQMRHEHDDTAELLRTLEQVAHGFNLPAGACGSWSALYTGLKKLSDDVVMHMHLENAVLFPRFEADRIQA